MSGGRGAVLVIAGTLAALAATARVAGAQVIGIPPIVGGGGGDDLPYPSSRTIYLNRTGGTYYQETASDDSSQNRSIAVANGTATVPPARLDDAEWATILECVRSRFAPFDAVVTTEDPGTAPHIEVVIGGIPAHIGRDPGVLGIAPLRSDCKVVERAVAFVFTETIININASIPELYLDEICAVTLQEAGHALGLDHALECEDPMTYLYGCSGRAFVDRTAFCGEYEPRTCYCGTQTQNSYQHLLGVFGPGVADVGPPEVRIAWPTPGEVVAPDRFEHIYAAAALDEAGIRRVTFVLDGEGIRTDLYAPYQVTEQGILAPGEHTLVVKALDVHGREGEASVTFTVSEPSSPVAPGDDDEGGCAVPGPRRGRGRSALLIGVAFGLLGGGAGARRLRRRGRASG